ncbi:protein kinase C and casein kinase substrate in neurons 2 protein-like [Haliotis asinina]|uniref:protein kinase C and casein kinase substrate in neurons 2 protein-like n=1 Tax=Haliotis asinina TaxID=109174 RepID=UPI00353205EE
MDQADQRMEPRKSCRASTEASLQRFTRGPRSMDVLLHVLTDYGKVEKKISQIYNEFEDKWKTRALTQIGSNLEYDQVNAVIDIWMVSMKEKEDLHSQYLTHMYANNGPIKTLQSYINSEDVNATRKATQNLYERTKKRQVKQEKEIDQLKEDFFLAKDKMVQFKPQMDAADLNPTPNTNFRELLGYWRKLEGDADGARKFYRQKLQEENSTRTTFIENMETFQKDSDAYERTRLENVQNVMLLMIQSSKTIELNRNEVLGQLYDKGISHLQKYNLQKEIDLYNVFYVYQHKFPREEPHPSEVLPEKEAEDKEKEAGDKEKEAEDKESSQETAKVDPSVEIDIVQVLPAQDNTTVFVQTTVDPATEMKPKAARYSRHVTFTTPNPKDVRYLPDVEIPNVVTERRQMAAPIVKETTVECAKANSDSDSDSDSDEDQSQRQTKASDIRNLAQGQKVKVYAVKDFAARAEDEISFKAGRKIYVTEAAVAGRVYGYIKKGKLVKRKVYGYFPEQLVSTNKKYKVKRSFLKRKLSKQLPNESSKNFISFN